MTPQASTEITTTAPDTDALFLRVGDRQWPVIDLQDASEKFCAVRNHMGFGGSEMPSVQIVDGTGTARFHVSYNGRVWHGPDGRDWQAGDKPAFDNAEVV